MMIDICVVGGGASGMIAAAAARMENPKASIRILEKKGAVGKKLLATGNGRCNLTNTACGQADEIIAFFKMLGVKTREEEQGRVYPYSGRAKDVLNAFTLFLNSRNIDVVTDFTVDSLNFDRPGEFAVCGEHKKNSEQITARKVLLAPGGQAGPQFGCSGDGYRMARAAGHTVTKIQPSLSPVECEGSFEGLKGVRAKATVTLLKNGAAVHSEAGELQFTEYGLSGICIFNISRHVRTEGCGFNDYEIAADLMADVGMDELHNELKSRRDELGIPIGELLVSLVPGELAGFVLDRAGAKRGGTADDAQVKRIAEALKGLKFTVSNIRGWKHAQCTSGGLAASEINMRTMESKTVKGLYFAGEIIDYDGPCGGYNLNNAWWTGIKAGRAMGADVQDS